MHHSHSLPPLHILFQKHLIPDTVFRNLQMKRNPEVPISLKVTGILVGQETSENRTSKPFKIVQQKKIKVVTSLGFSNTQLHFLKEMFALISLSNASQRVSSGGQPGCPSLRPALPSDFASCLLKLGFDCASMGERFTFSYMSAKCLPQCLSPLDAVIMITIIIMSTIPSAHSEQ